MRPALRRWGWFLLLWLGGTGSVTVVALAIRLVLHPG
jgi:hypothetical protein